MCRNALKLNLIIAGDAGMLTINISKCDTYEQAEKKPYKKCCDPKMYPGAPQHIFTAFTCLTKRSEEKKNRDILTQRH